MAASSISIVSSSPPPWLMSSRSIQISSNSSPSASLSLATGSRTRSNFSMNAATSSTTRSRTLHCSFLPSSPLSFPSSVSGISLGLDLNSNIGVRKDTAGGLMVRAGKAALCQTKRNRSRKSLARTHGFRRRMRTTSGRAVLKRRRAKGRKVLCTKSYPNSGKAA